MMSLKQAARSIVFTLLAGACTQQAEAPPAQATEIAWETVADLFGDIDATFVLADGRGQTLLVNPMRAEQRFLPASTFKIANSLIALDAGIVADASFALNWDSVAAPAEPWWPTWWKREQTLETAFRNSVFWYYQEIARRIGDQRMREYLRQFDYGNQDIAGGIDQFWLRGGLRISPTEQIDFLRRFYHEQLGVSSHATAIVKRILVLEDTPEFRLSGKTGTAEVTATRELGWIVGYIEQQGQVHFFALNMEGEEVWEAWPPQKRAALVKSILRRLGVISKDPDRDQAVSVGGWTDAWEASVSSREFRVMADLSAGLSGMATPSTGRLDHPGYARSAYGRRRDTLAGCGGTA